VCVKTVVPCITLAQLLFDECFWVKLLLFVVVVVVVVVVVN
jgi:hypothetical protein